MKDQPLLQPRAEIKMLLDILKRHLGLASESDAPTHEELDALPAPQLEPWEKAHVIEAIWQQILEAPCACAMLLTGITHQEAHAAINRACEIRDAIRETRASKAAIQ